MHLLPPHSKFQAADPDPFLCQAWAWHPYHLPFLWPPSHSEWTKDPPDPSSCFGRHGDHGNSGQKPRDASYRDLCIWAAHTQLRKQPIRATARTLKHGTLFETPSNQMPAPGEDYVGFQFETTLSKKNLDPLLNNCRILHTAMKYRWRKYRSDLDCDHCTLTMNVLCVSLRFMYLSMDHVLMFIYLEISRIK